ncbi:MAG: YHS domain protein [Thermoanaerobaculia bacterium]|nr:YHS domain protein [Thermoanaerobaculia bacterium]
MTQRTFDIPSALALFAIAVFTSLTGAHAADSVNTTRRGVAIEGYDPVSYFTDGAPVAGQKDLTFAWNGATWRFSSVEHRDLFAAAPERYAPQFGGYCAWAVAHGKTAGIDPEAWKIVEGRLYLNYSRKIQRRWEEDIEGNIARAEGHWPSLVDD